MAIAVHESGHCIAAVRLGVGVKRVTLRGVWTRHVWPDHASAQPIVALSGPLAEDKFAGYDVDEHSRLWGTAWALDKANAAKWLAGGDADLALRRARQLVSDNWHLIERLARALADRHELSGAEIAELLRSTR